MTEINQLQTQINTTDKEIEQMVYALYGLTEENIRLFAKHRHKNERYPISDARKHNHKSIINAFSRYLILENNTYPYEMRSYLKELQNHRHLADYDPGYSFDKEDVELILQKAVYFCTVKSKLEE